MILFLLTMMFGGLLHLMFLPLTIIPADLFGLADYAHPIFTPLHAFVAVFPYAEAPLNVLKMVIIVQLSLWTFHIVKWAIQLIRGSGS